MNNELLRTELSSGLCHLNKYDIFLNTANKFGNNDFHKLIDAKIEVSIPGVVFLKVFYANYSSSI